MKSVREIIRAKFNEHEGSSGAERSNPSTYKNLQSTRSVPILIDKLSNKRRQTLETSCEETEVSKGFSRVPVCVSKLLKGSVQG